MSKKFLTNINLTKNEIQNIVIHKLATAPTSPVLGQIYFNTADEILYQRRASGWKDISGSLNDVTAGSTAIAITDNGDNTLNIDVLEATSILKGLMSPTDKTKLDNATASNTASTIVQRDATGNFSANDITANDVQITGASGSWTANSAVNKSYVDNLVAGGIKIIAVIDCSTEPNYPSATVGDAWHVSVAGKIGGASGEVVEVGDMIVAVNTSAGGTEASVGSDFIIMQKNIDDASTTVAGVIRIATLVEVGVGTATDVAVTPEGLAQEITAMNASSKYASNVGDGSATSFVVNHALGSTDVHIQLQDNATKELVETDVVSTDANNVTVSFNVAPASNAYRTVIQG